MTLISKIHALLVAVGRFLQCPLLLAIRLFWGWQFFIAGRGKLMHLDKAAEFFASLNIPMPKLNAILASSTECSCGILLMLGLFSRFASLALVCVMCVAFWTAERAAVVGIFNDPDKFFAATPFLFLYASLLVLAFGPGKVALDTFVFREKEKKA